MNGYQVSTDVDRQFRTMTIIWGAMLLSVAAYGAVAHLMRIGTGDVSFVRTLAVALGVMTVVELGVQRFFLGWLRDEKLFPGTLDPGRSPLANRGVDYSALPPEERAPRMILGARTTLGIILWALGESITIYGLMLALISGNPLWFYPFAAVGVGSMIFHRPRRSDFDAQMERWRVWHLTRRR